VSAVGCSRKLLFKNHSTLLFKNGFFPSCEIAADEIAGGMARKRFSHFVKTLVHSASFGENPSTDFYRKNSEAANDMKDGS
jgi:hypothetical protein